ncbi:ferritin family protein, partial [Pseudomonadota bacterium]
MSVLFTAAEIVTMAIEAEKNGLAFYQAMVSKATDENVRNIFAFLAKEEAEHE